MQVNLGKTIASVPLIQILCSIFPVIVGRVCCWRATILAVVPPVNMLPGRLMNMASAQSSRRALLTFFSTTALKNGLLPLVLNKVEVDALFAQCQVTEGYTLTVDLAAQQVITLDGTTYAFQIDTFRKHCLLNGLDDIGLTLQHAEAIRAFEATHRIRQPWLFAPLR